MDNCPTGVRLESEVTHHTAQINGIVSDIKEIKDSLIKRPTWAVCVIITILTALTCSSITWAVTVLKIFIK